MSSSSSDDDIVTITLISMSTGQSELIPNIPSKTTTIQQLIEWSIALLGMSSSSSSSSSSGSGGGGGLVFKKDGHTIGSSSSSLSKTLHDAGIRNGDMLAVEQQQQQQHGSGRRQQPAAAARNSGGGGGGGLLDFSSLLGGGSGSGSSSAAAAAASSSSAASGAASAAAAAAASSTRTPVYYPGMSLNDAMQYNPHPETMVQLLMTKEHLFKELNYHNPTLAMKLQNAITSSAVAGSSSSSNDSASPPEGVVTVWRNETVRDGIEGAVRASKYYHTEREMKQRIQQNPNDSIAIEYYSKQNQKRALQESYIQMMEEYPESLGRVLMLYIDAKINGYPIQPFCDSGAQMTIMSENTCRKCGLIDLVDERFAGYATGVGTGRILGRIHVVQLQINNYYFPCSVSVMASTTTTPPASSSSGSSSSNVDNNTAHDDDDDDNNNDRKAIVAAKEMPFLLGLDMMKRHLCQIDLERGMLRFRVGGSSQYMETPFLHEKDLSVAQGGTKDFNAEEANAEFLKHTMKDVVVVEDDEKEKKNNNNNNKQRNK